MKRLNLFAKFIGYSLWKMRYFKYRLEIVPDNPSPETVKENIVYVVGNEEYVKWAYLKCPCGCNDIIMLSLSKFHKPSWCIKQDFIGRPTINPSIFKLDGCRSHFWIKKGKLKWSYF